MRKSQKLPSKETKRATGWRTKGTVIPMVLKDTRLKDTLKDTRLKVRSLSEFDESCNLFVAPEDVSADAGRLHARERSSVSLDDKCPELTAGECLIPGYPPQQQQFYQQGPVMAPPAYQQAPPPRNRGFLEGW